MGGWGLVDMAYLSDLSEWIVSRLGTFALKPESCFIPAVHEATRSGVNSTVLNITSIVRIFQIIFCG